MKARRGMQARPRRGGDRKARYAPYLATGESKYDAPNRRLENVGPGHGEVKTVAQVVEELRLERLGRHAPGRWQLGEERW